MNLPLSVWVVGSVLLISSLSLTGLIFLRWEGKRIQKLLGVLVSFAVGGLLGDCFFHLLPELYGTPGNAMERSSMILAGFLFFFALERSLLWHHHGELHVHGEKPETLPLAYTLLLGDSAHNFMDGVLVAATYQASIPLGLATTLAVIFHEIPHEIGDFAALIHAGFSVRKALLANILSSLVALVGAFVGLYCGSLSPAFSATLVPVTAGAFIYVAASDLIPELSHKLKDDHPLGQIFALGTGMLLLYILSFFV